MSWFTKVFDRIEISGILGQHLSTFYHYEKHQFYNKTTIPFSDKILFIVIPILLAVFFCLLGLRFNLEYVNITLTCLSIFAGLLFGLLTMVFSLIQENQKNEINDITPDQRKKIVAKADLTKHLFINIEFAIVLSLAALIFVLSTQFYPSKIIAKIQPWQYYEFLKRSYYYFSNGTSFFLIIEFLLTLLMIIRRFSILFLNQVSI